METAPLGSQRLMVSRQGLGCMGMSEFYGAGDDDESVATIHRALDLGLTFFDTADMYGPFTNEVLLGGASGARRDEAAIATKFGNVRDPDDPTKRGSNGRPEYVRQACGASLSRLGTDHIDPPARARSSHRHAAIARRARKERLPTSSAAHDR